MYIQGEYIDFQPGFVGSLWHPSLGLTKYNSNDENQVDLMLLKILLKASDTYYTFPDESKLLLKFKDDSIAELNSFGSVIKDFKCTRVGSALFDIYYTGRYYVLTDDVKEKLLTMPITKVRIELSNGDRKDYEVSEKHGKKVLKKLQKSHEQINKVQETRINNVNNDLKTDF